MNEDWGPPASFSKIWTGDLILFTERTYAVLASPGQDQHLLVGRRHKYQT